MKKHRQERFREMEDEAEMDLVGLECNRETFQGSTGTGLLPPCTDQVSASR